jgi:hypothetical protein
MRLEKGAIIYQKMKKVFQIILLNYNNAVVNTAKENTIKHIDKKM